MTVSVRAATPADAGEFARIHTACFDQAWNEESFRHLLQRPGAVALIARHADATQSQGFILVQVAAGESEIISIGTLPGRRRSGIAAALLAEAAAEAVRRHAEEMFLEVAEDNEAALALYAGFGFVAAGRRHSYYIRAGRPAADALMLHAALPLQNHGNSTRSRLD